MLSMSQKVLRNGGGGEPTFPMSEKASGRRRRDVAPQARRGPGGVAVQCVGGGAKSAISRCDVLETLAL